MAKATKTIRQALNYQPDHAAWFAANQDLFNRVVAFYFGVINAHEKLMDLSNKEALSALEKLTHQTTDNPDPIMPLTSIAEHIPAMFRRAAINAALGSAHAFFSSLKKWKAKKAKAEARGKKCGDRPPVPHAPGENPPHSMQVCGKTEPLQLSCSRCGPVRVGPRAGTRSSRQGSRRCADGRRSRRPSGAWCRALRPAPRPLP